MTRQTWGMNSVEDLETMEVRKWRPTSQDRGKWQEIIKEAKVHHGP
jgi:hypothetical protein